MHEHDPRYCLVCVAREARRYSPPTNYYGRVGVGQAPVEANTQPQVTGDSPVDERFAWLRGRIHELQDERDGLLNDLKLTSQRWNEASVRAREAEAIAVHLHSVIEKMNKNHNANENVISNQRGSIQSYQEQVEKLELENYRLCESNDALILRVATFIKDK